MFIGLSVILVLMAMGGLIAFLGDRIGSKVGKKRLTVFGLRPKYSSVIITIVSGTLISCLTVATMAVLNENVRVALFGLSKLHVEMDQLTEEIEKKNKALEHGQQLLDEKNKEIATMNHRMDTIGEELAQVENQRNNAREQLSLVQEAYEKAKADINTSAAEIKALEETKSELTANIDKLNEEKEILIGSISAIREGTVIFRAGQIINTAVVEDNMDHDTAARVLASILNDINGALCERLNVQDKKTVLVRVPQEDFEKAVNEITGITQPKLIRIVAAGNIILGESAVVTFDIHDNLTVFKAGQTVLEKDITEYENFQNLDMKVLRFLKDVNKTSQEKGVLPDPITGDVGELDTREMLDVIQQVHDLSGRCILRAVAKRDTTTEGPVVITVKVIPK